MINFTLLEFSLRGLFYAMHERSYRDHATLWLYEDGTLVAFGSPLKNAIPIYVIHGWWGSHTPVTKHLTIEEIKDYNYKRETGEFCSTFYIEDYLKQVNPTEYNAYLDERLLAFHKDIEIQISKALEKIKSQLCPACGFFMTEMGHYSPEVLTTFYSYNCQKCGHTQEADKESIAN